MANSGDRFYQLEFRNRPVLRGDIGSLLQIAGIIVYGNGAFATLLLPSVNMGDVAALNWHLQQLSVEEWSEYLQRSDDPEVLVMPAKAFHRKLRYEISGAVQQKVWVADGFKCMYCGAPMGKAQLTIDHFIPIELGGENDQSNYLSACRRCNKDKGSEDPQLFCERRQLGSFAFLKGYLSTRKIT